jgi:hypothetical protein
VTLGIVAVVVVLAGAMLWLRGDGSDDRGGSVELRVGDTAPAFSLPGASGAVYALDELVMPRKVLLYFSMGPG